MSRYFTYTNLPEHQVAIYHDETTEMVYGERRIKQDCIGFVITGFCTLLLFLTFPISVFFCVKVLKDYERAIVFRIGRLLKPKGPGVIFIIPCVDKWSRVDMRTRAFSVPPQEVLTKDEGWISVGADIQFNLKDPVLSQTAVQDLNHSLRMLARTALVNCLSTRTLLQAETDRKFINLQMQNDANKSAKNWGAEIQRVTISEVRVIKEAPSNEGVDIAHLFKGGASPSTMNMLAGLLASAVGRPPSQPSTVKKLQETSTLDASPAKLVQLASSVLDEALVRELGGLYQFNIQGEDGGAWIMDLRSGSGTITKVDAPDDKPNDKPNDKPDVILTMTTESMKTIFQGEITPFNAYMQELLKVEGDLKMAMNLEVIVEKIKRRQSDSKKTGSKSGVYIV